MGKRTVCLLFLLLYIFFSLHPKAHAAEAKPKVLSFSAIDTEYLSDTVRHWGGDVGINGFMLAYVAQWYSPKKEIFKNLKTLKKINRKGAKYGVDSNFIKVALGYKELPLWTDDAGWAGVIDNFKNIAELIKKSGTKGIAIDTEPYTEHVELFDSKAGRFSNIEKDRLRTAVRRRGREIMQALTKVYPDIEVILLQEGSYHWFISKYPQYEMWMDFYNGMASVGNKKGIVIGAENTYSKLDMDSLSRINSLINGTMQKNAQDPAFWNDKCSIALGVWPLGKNYTDKSARYSAPDFKKQLSYAMSLSPKYVWIYDHGTAWLQLDEKEIKKYTANGRTIWTKESQALPVAPEIKDYYSVVRELSAR